ncbi:MAG TPA: tripartite tricarboxylate transporter substrate binding protein [Burkholderiales bacterium]|nr:tripartite tricarboxylate transporter substrate binding protein [Burkholderiales bacterium]
MAAALSSCAAAAEYPARPIRFIVPFAAGSGPDVTARLLALDMTQQMGQQIVIDNRAGAAGSIGTEIIVRAAPDGYTIGYGSISTLAINRSMLSRLPYDPDKDLQKIVQTYSAPNMVAITLSLPVKSVQELIDYAKNNPGKLTFGSSGSGTSPHLSGELFKLMTGTQMVHVPYKTFEQTITDMIGGRLHLTFNNVGPMMPHVKAGRIRGLGVTGLKRLPAAPELPTIAETVPGFEVTAWAGVVAPVGVPKAIVTRLSVEINKALTSPTLKEKYAALGYDLVGGTPEQFDAFAKKEVAKWAEAVKRSGAKID